MRPIADFRNIPMALACALALSLSAAGSAGLHAKTWCVPAPGPGCDAVAPSITNAIQAAVPGDTIRVGAGTFVEGAVWIEKPLTLLGAQAGVDARGRSGAPGTESIIVPSVVPNMPILVLGPGSAGSVIDGFTLAGGNLSIQNGLRPGESNDRLQIRNNRLFGFWAAGIALAAPGIDITIERNHVDGSSVNHPDMLVSVRAGAPYPGLQVTDNTIVNGRMQATGFAVFDPAAVVGRSVTRSPLIRGNTFVGNSGGAVIMAVFEDGEISDNVFEMNNGAGLQGRFTRTLITRNLSLGNAGPGMAFLSGLVPGAMESNQIHGNAIVGNQVGATYDGSDTIYAAGNYWGSESGPFHRVRNPVGSGNAVVDQEQLGTGTGRIVFDPWLVTSPVPLPTARTWCVPSLAAGCDLASATIGAAVRSARPGDTVKVAADTYVEGAVWITKPLMLRGAQAGVDARGRVGAESTITVADSMMPVIVLGAGSAGSVIDGFTLLGGDLGIQNDGSSLASIGGLQVLNNRITGFWAAGIALSYPGDDITIDRNIVDGSGVKHPSMLVSLTAGGSYRGFWLTNNEIVNGGTQTFGFNIPDGNAQVGPSAARTSLLKGNRFAANMVGASLGWHFEFGEISDNAFVGNAEDGLRGALKSTVVTRNAFEANGGPGMILATTARDNEITDNTFVGNVRGGLAAGPLAGTLVARNTFRSNGTGGPAIGVGFGDMATGNTIVDNEVSDNQGDGIAGGPIASVIARNALVGNQGVAMALFSGARDNEITDNTVVGNGRGGISAMPLAGTLVARNSFRSNGATGPAMALGGGGSGNTIVDNELRANASDGIAGGPIDSLIARNTLAGNRGFAIALFSGARDNEITGNAVLENGQLNSCASPSDPYGCGGGISLGNRLISSVPTNVISGNTISGNRIGAVYHGPNATQLRDLRGNDWGDGSGPYHAVRNPTGTGDAVVDNSSDPVPAFAGMILFDPWIATGYTPAGSSVDVEITATLPGGSAAAVSVGFDQVLTAGVTSVTASEATPPDGFQLGDPPVQYEVSTTAAFSGSVELCFAWTEGQFFNEQAIRLYHYEADAWVDVTTAVDTGSNVACGSVTSLSPFALMEVAYAFSGFFPPVSSAPAVNIAKAGQAVPVKFSLGGDRGLDIFGAGYPASQAVACAGSTDSGVVVATVSAGASALQYDGTNEQYTYVWKTDRAWANTCRVLILGFNDGSWAAATFQFR